MRRRWWNRAVTVSATALWLAGWPLSASCSPPAVDRDESGEDSTAGLGTRRALQQVLDLARELKNEGAASRQSHAPVRESIPIDFLSREGFVEFSESPFEKIPV